MTGEFLRRFIRWVIRCLLLSVISLLLLIILAIVWIWYLHRPPHYAITPPTIPAHNAFDYFMRAGHSLNRQQDLYRFTISLDKSGILILDNEKVKKRQQHPLAYSKQTTLLSREIPSVLPSILAANQQALCLIREGLQYDYVRPLDLYNRPISKSEHPRDVVCLSYCRRLLEVNAFYQFNHADAFSAANALIDYLQLSILLMNFHEDYSDKGLLQLKSLSDRLTVQQAREIVARLENMSERRPSFAEFRARAKPYILYDMNGYLEIISHIDRDFNKNYYGEYHLPQFHQDQFDERSPIISLLEAWTVPNKSVPGRADRYLSECICVARKPFNVHASYPSPPTDVYNWLWFGSEELVNKQLSCLSWGFQQDGLMLTIALRGYYREQHRYPDALEELLRGHWLQRLPVDPFTQQGTIGYRKQGASFELYCAGPDGKDDGGKRIRSRYMRLDSRRDMVYGIHTQVNFEVGGGRL